MTIRVVEKNERQCDTKMKEISNLMKEGTCLGKGKQPEVI